MWSRVIFSISGKLAKLDVFSLSIELNDIEIDLSLIKVISNRFGTSWNLLLSQKLSPRCQIASKLKKKLEKSKKSKISNLVKEVKNEFQIQTFLHASIQASFINVPSDPRAATGSAIDFYFVLARSGPIRCRLQSLRDLPILARGSLNVPRII